MSIYLATFIHSAERINKLFYSILFYSILFYSILFYSILFYSILFLFVHTVLQHPGSGAVQPWDV
jgi:hypothetical protein